MKRVVIAIAAFAALGATLAVGQEDPVKARQANFKAMGAALREPGGMLRGAAPFDLAKVQAALTVIADNSAKNVKLFPSPTPAGVETEALPVIWEKKADFEALMTKLGTDAKTASAAIKDEASFKTEMPKVLGNCGTCHNTYRVKKS